MKADALKRKLEKKYPKTIYTGEEIKGITVARLPSGSFVFDMITGGGLPKNRFTVFHGPKSSSKSTFALRVIGQFQTLYPDMVATLIDFEGTFDEAWAANFLPDRDRLHLIQPDYGEQGVDMAKAYAAEAEDCGLIVVDSLAAINATKEAESDAADNMQIGLQVKLINRLIRVLLPLLSQAKKRGQDLTILFINQIRANMAKSGPYGAQYSQPGGKFLEHASSMDVRFYTGEYTKSREISVKVKHTMMVDKNKTATPKRSGDLVYWLQNVKGHAIGELDEFDVVLTYARRAGIIVKDGATFVIPFKKEPLVFKTLGELHETLKEDPKLFQRVKTLTLRECIKNPYFTSEDKEKEGE